MGGRLVPKHSGLGPSCHKCKKPMSRFNNGGPVPFFRCMRCGKELVARV